MIDRLCFCGDVWVPSASTIVARQDLEGLVINLEAPIATAGESNPFKICLKQDPDVLKSAFIVPPVAACLANNHIFDFGIEGFLETVRVLDDARIKYYGAGNNANNFNNPAMLVVGGMEVALLGYVCPTTHPATGGNGWGVAPIDLARISNDVRRAKELGASRVVVSLHWGDEEVNLPKPEDLEVARSLMTMDIDLVVGHHAHVRQPVYVHPDGGKHLFFGLGNAVFSDFDYVVDGRTFAWAKQRAWNRTGVLVDFVPGSNSVVWRLIKQTGNDVFVPKSGKMDVWRSLPSDKTSYVKRYVFARKLAMLRLVMSKALARPRMPTLARIKSILRAANR